MRAYKKYKYVLSTGHLNKNSDEFLILKDKRLMNSYEIRYESSYIFEEYFLSFNHATFMQGCSEEKKSDGV